jgi:hypothetical protein
VVQWLDDSVDPNIKYDEHNDRHSPYYVSATAQIAVWKSQNGLWEVEQRGRWDYIEITCKDERMLLEVALKWN